MAQRRSVGTILALVGILFMVVAVLADYIGLGSGGSMGNKQMLLLVVGAALGIVGFYMRRQK
jgi:hypothetical protein